MREVEAVLLVLTLTAVVSAQDEEEPRTILCGQEFYDECFRLTEEHTTSMARRDIADSEAVLDLRGESTDLARALRSIPTTRAKRGHAPIRFMPMSLGIMQETCCKLGCNEKYLLLTCR